MDIAVGSSLCEFIHDKNLIICLILTTTMHDDNYQHLSGNFLKYILNYPRYAVVRRDNLMQTIFFYAKEYPAARHFINTLQTWDAVCTCQQLIISQLTNTFSHQIDLQEANEKLKRNAQAGQDSEGIKRQIEEERKVSSIPLSFHTMANLDHFDISFGP